MSRCPHDDIAPRPRFERRPVRVSSLASGQVRMRNVDGWETLDQPIADESLDLAA